VCFYVLLSGILRVLGSINMVPVRQVRVMAGFLMVPSFVMLGCFPMMASGMLMMFSRLRVMVGCFL
jgi:hypothetical protein